MSHSLLLPGNSSSRGTDFIVQLSSVFPGSLQVLLLKSTCLTEDVKAIMAIQKRKKKKNKVTINTKTQSQLLLRNRDYIVLKQINRLINGLVCLDMVTAISWTGPHGSNLRIDIKYQHSFMENRSWTTGCILLFYILSSACKDTCTEVLPTGSLSNLLKTRWTCNFL